MLQLDRTARDLPSTLVRLGDPTARPTRASSNPSTSQITNPPTITPSIDLIEGTTEPKRFSQPPTSPAKRFGALDLLFGSIEVSLDIQTPESLEISRGIWLKIRADFPTALWNVRINIVRNSDLKKEFCHDDKIQMHVRM